MEVKKMPCTAPAPVEKELMTVLKSAQDTLFRSMPRTEPVPVVEAAIVELEMFNVGIALATPWIPRTAADPEPVLTILKLLATSDPSKRFNPRELLPPDAEEVSETFSKSAVLLLTYAPMAVMPDAEAETSSAERVPPS